MFIAKIKTAALVLCGVAALGAGTGGVYYQTRVGAADSPQGDRVVQDNRKRAAAPEERELDKLRRENNSLVKALADEKAEQVLQRINWEVTVAGLKRALAAARTDQDNRKKAAETKKQERMETLQEIRKALEGNSKQLKEESKRLREERGKLEILEKITKDDMEAIRRDLAKVDAEIKSTMTQQAANEHNPTPSQKPASGDKLDQILQRLERLEKRLDRLEKDRK